MKRISFNLELAKEITNEKKEGRIVTRDGRSARIICWDRKDSLYTIVALIQNQNIEIPCTFTIDGILNEYIGQNINDLFIEVPDEQKCKEGDVVVNRNDTIGILYEAPDDDKVSVLCVATYQTCSGVLCFNDNMLCKDIRLATKKEKQTLIEAMKKKSYGKAKEYLERFFGITMPRKFEPFDKVLVRKSCSHPGCAVWNAALYNRAEGDIHFIIGDEYECADILPYNEQTKHLLGTTDDLKE